MSTKPRKQNAAIVQHEPANTSPAGSPVLRFVAGTWTGRILAFATLGSIGNHAGAFLVGCALAGLIAWKVAPLAGRWTAIVQAARMPLHAPAVAASSEPADEPSEPEAYEPEEAEENEPSEPVAPAIEQPASSRSLAMEASANHDRAMAALKGLGFKVSDAKTALERTYAATGAGAQATIRHAVGLLTS
jgi:hypothetical protein